MLVGDVRDEDPWIAVRPQPRPCLVPDEVTLGHEPRGIRPPRQIRPNELIASMLVGVADDHDRVPAGSEHPGQFDEHGLHPVQVAS